MAENSLKLVIEVDAATGTAKIRQFGEAAEGALNQVHAAGQKLEGGFAKTWQGMSTGFASATYLFNEARAAFSTAWGLAEKAAQYEEVRKGLHELAAEYGVTADAVAKMAKEAVGGQLSLQESAQLAAKALTLGFDPKQMSGFLEQAERLTDVVGGDIPTAFEAMEKAAATGRSKGLVQYGIVVDLTKALEDYALKHGISKDAIDAHTATQIRANAILEEARRTTARMGDAGESTADKMNVMRASMKDIELWLGQATIRAGAGAYGALAGMAAGALALYAGLQKLRQGVAWAVGNDKIYADAKADAEAAWAAAEELGGKSKDAFKLMVADAYMFAKTMKKTLTDTGLLPEELSKEYRKHLSDQVTADFKEMVRVLTEFEKESARVGKSTEQNEIDSLNVRLAAYQKYGADEIRLEELKQAGLRDIMLKANNERITLYEELYKATANEAYAQKAIAAMKEILDAEESKWATILKNDDEAHALRLKREQEYVDKFKEKVEQTIEVERSAAEERSQIQSSSGGVSGGGSYFSSGLPTGPGSGGLIINGNIYSYSAGEAYLNQLAQVASARQAAIATYAQKIADENKRIAEEYQREYEARVSTLKSARQGLTGFVQDRERRNWGMTDYQSEFTRLSESFSKSEYFEDSIDLLGQMLDTLKSLDSIEQDMLQANRGLAEDLKSQSQSISDWLVGLGMGDLAPVQSAEAWGVRYNDLLTAAKEDTKNIGEFLTYAQEYLQFQKTYGSSGSYAAAFGSVTGAVGDLGGTVGLLAILADLGLGTTTDDLGKLVKAFKDMGVPIGELATAAGLAKDQIGTASETNTLNSALDILKGVASTSAGAEGLKKIIDALGITLPQSAIDSMTNAGLLARVLSDATPTGNMTSLITTMTTNVQGQLATVAGFFDTLATRMGLTMNGGSAQTAINALTPPPVQVGVTKTVVTTVQTSPFIAAHEDISYNNIGQMIRSWDPGSPAHGKIIWSDGTITNYGKGGLMRGPSIGGEMGDEWAVPTYEPERSRFLNSAPPDFWGNLGVQPGNGGASLLDADALGRNVGRQIAAAIGGGSGSGEIIVKVYLDGKEIRSAVAEGYRQGDRNLIEQTRRRMQ